MKAYTVRLNDGKEYTRFIECTPPKSGHGLVVSLIGAGTIFETPSLQITKDIPNETDTAIDGTLAYLDIKELPWVEKFITENKFGQFAGKRTVFEDVSYPLYRMDLSKLRQ